MPAKFCTPALTVPEKEVHRNGSFVLANMKVTAVPFLSTGSAVISK